MDYLTKIYLKKAIIKALEDYRNFLGSDPESEIELVIDETRDHYLLIETLQVMLMFLHKTSTIYLFSFRFY